MKVFFVRSLGGGGGFEGGGSRTSFLDTHPGTRRV